MNAQATGQRAARSAVLGTRLDDFDPETAAAIDAEPARQRGTLETIAGEDVAPLAVTQAQSSVLTDTYAEGCPGRRSYGGCEHVDVIERLAVDRAKQLCGAEAANGQPHSGAQANAPATALLPGFDDRTADALRHRVRVLTDRFPLHPADPRLAAQEAAQ